MRPAALKPWCGLPAALAVLLLATALPAAAALLRIDSALAALHPEGASAPPPAMVTLPHRWDKVFPGRGGRVLYRIELPPVAAGSSTSLLFERLGNQATLRLDGQLLQHFGGPGDSRSDFGKSSQRVVVPPALWRGGVQSLEVELVVQPLRGGGLGVVEIGPADEVDAELAQRRWWQLTAPAAYAASLLLVGCLAAALWWRQRDALYGCFALAALFGMLRYLDPVLQPPPLPWPLWGALLAAGYAGHLGFIARFVLLALDRHPPSLVRAVHLVLAAALVLGPASFALMQPALWTAALIGLEAVGLACFAVVGHEAWTRRRPLAWLVLAVGGLLLTAGLHDILLVRLALAGGDRPTLTPHALFFCVLILAGIFVHRYNQSVAQHRELNRTLARRVAEREDQLQQAFDTLRQQRDEQAAQAERQRIMREIHDGIGSQLVALLNMVGRSDARALEAQVRLALDEMRMAVDSLQPGHSELTTLLATLRYRLQSRLQAAGITSAWAIAGLPDNVALPLQDALHLQRILLEALTNVLKHAQAQHVTVQAHWVSGPAARLQLSVQDDGVGLPATGPAAGGHGLRNMQARAQALGATLTLRPADGGGSVLLLDWPLAAVSTSSDRL